MCVSLSLSLTSVVHVEFVSPGVEIARACLLLLQLLVLAIVVPVAMQLVDAVLVDGLRLVDVCGHGEIVRPVAPLVARLVAHSHAQRVRGVGAQLAHLVQVAVEDELVVVGRLRLGAVAERLLRRRDQVDNGGGGICARRIVAVGVGCVALAGTVDGEHLHVELANRRAGQHGPLEERRVAVERQLVVVDGDRRGTRDHLEGHARLAHLVLDAAHVVAEGVRGAHERVAEHVLSLGGRVLLDRVARVAQRNAVEQERHFRRRIAARHALDRLLALQRRVQHAIVHVLALLQSHARFVCSVQLL